MSAPTSLLYLDTLLCLRQHDNPFDADSPYLLLFAGQPGPQPQADVVRITSRHWHNRTRSGRLHLVNSWIHHDVRPASVLLVAMLEQNWQLDLNDAALESLRRAMQTRWSHFVRRMASASLPLAAQHAFKRQLQCLLRNDALIQIRPLPLSTLHGTLPALNFSGHGARYRASFHTRRLQAAGLTLA
ncbi:hypothetical protein [Uliginosibacterium sp. 31-12]|uniref:hypothetical protein n=1 Tax=Uliginosibacterium sp. 31-12 TaxID=3062781 RepID=UPI0026E1C599|nr:hypothetical protein [Uliginosibacterium sp. 31-12]MDO6386972.1 hypothetical protein [Uliginosibacterium sp. 31-12]